MGKSRNASAYRKKHNTRQTDPAKTRKRPVTPRTRAPMTAEERLFRAQHMHAWGYQAEAREELLWLILEVVSEKE